MSKTSSPDSILSRSAMHLGTVMMMAWTLIIGGLGFMLLIGVYYAMVAHSQSLLLTCCFFLLSPLLLTVVFGCLSLAELVTKQIAVSDGATDTSWWEKRKDYRVIYQAYYL
jgi:hypothetical protein